MASGKKRCTYNKFSFTIEKRERTLLPFSIVMEMRHVSQKKK